MLKRLLLLSLLPFCSYAEELPAPVKAIEKQGITIIKPFDAPGGMKGWLGKYQDMGVAIYLTPDGKHAISGYMYDENGNNLSEQLFQKELYTPAGQEMWKKMASAHWLQDGNKEAPIVLYVFADPFCPYCKQFWQQSRPWVEAGKVQIRTLLVGVIKPERPATAALTDASDPRSQGVPGRAKSPTWAWAKRGGGDGPQPLLSWMLSAPRLTHSDRVRRHKTYKQRQTQSDRQKACGDGKIGRASCRERVSSPV